MRLIAPAALLGLAACTALPPAGPLPAGSPPQRIEAELNAHTEQIGQLQRQIAEMRQQISELQHHQPHPRPARRSTSAPAEPSPAPAENPQEQAYRQAQQLYRSGSYSQALHQLRFAERSGSGGQTEQNALFLLMQSHEKLRNCESVILTGQRFATRFAANPKAAEALYSVGSCQWSMQQRDIARNTWRKLMQTYPNSPAARRAGQRIQNNR
ncbi:outer membrane protein assembly factor BamD [Eikenella sp. S3360]|uniref:Outer membrane protein assembly factor BamD n=1 Tax=Eikenella glucosivorans TaxID=2766967 RepID=A0ABS0NDG3_9NEIS|nr:outer membrane protein assembly factor BamD [Eikenella glucosivorans]MBH5330358.1 outer membrane protein assembly factor BamD [Eikenella glucosivorans]